MQENTWIQQAMDVLTVKGKRISRKGDIMFNNIKSMSRWHVKYYLRKIKNVIVASIMGWLFGKIYELDPSKWYVFSIKKPRRGELEYLADTLPLGNNFLLKGLIWGPGLEVETLEKFTEKILEGHNQEELQELAKTCELVMGKMSHSGSEDK